MLSTVLKWVSALAAVLPVAAIANNPAQISGNDWTTLVQNLATTAGLGGLAAAFSTETAKNWLTFGRSVWAKYDESNIPNGCLRRANGIMDALEAEVPIEALQDPWLKILKDSKAYFDSQKPPTPSAVAAGDVG